MNTASINDQFNALAGKFHNAIKRTSALDWLNFLLADVKGGLGPFLAVYLSSSQHWEPGQIGVVMAIGGTATVLAQAPMGALVDWSQSKRSLIVGAAGVVAACSLLITWFEGFWPVAINQALIGVADAVFPSAIATISLGLVGPHAMSYRVGRNVAFNSAGNVVTALLAGIAGWALSQEAMLWLITVAAAGSIRAVLSINGDAIDNNMARGLEASGQNQQPVNLRELFICKPLLIFAAAITLYHFANAAMLPILGQKLAQSHLGSESLVIAACIITAQIIMVPMAMLVGRKADLWGHKPFFMVGFAILPVRGLLYTLSQDPIYLVSIQILDGIGAGIFGALFFIVVADLMQGTGRYGFALGVLTACMGLGAVLSHAVTGFIVDSAGFDVAFLFLATIALMALLLYWLAMPETGVFIAKNNEAM